MRTIRQLRQDAGLTQFQLAVQAGVSPSTVYGWEAGKYEPKASQLRSLARVFDVSMDDIDFESPLAGKDAA